MALKEKPIVRKEKLKNPTKFTYKAKDGNTYTLTKLEKAFCDYYMQFGAKGVDAVYEAGYDPKNARVAYSISCENLTKPHIFNYIQMHYEEYGFNDEDVMKQHLFLINQDGDLGSKAKGVDMYYKKKGVYAPEKIEQTITSVNIINYGDKKDV
jgi:hypothetical protein